MSGQSDGRTADLPDWPELVAGLAVSPADRQGSEPLWLLVARRLEALISSGRITTGTRMPDEVSLATQLGISRPTMRRAMGELVDHGMVVRRPGAGTRVVALGVRRRVELTSLFDDLTAAGRDPCTVVLSMQVEPADDALALALRIAPRSEVTAIRRLRLADDRPLAVMSNHVPLTIARLHAEQLVAGGLYASIRALGGPEPSTAREVIGARAATAEEGELLQISTGAPVLTMTRTAWGPDGQGVEHGAHVYRADRYAVEHHLTRG